MSIKELSQSILDASKSVIELSEMKVSMQIVPGSEKKLMPLAKKAGVRLQKPKPGDDEAHVMGDKKSLRKFMMMRGMSADDIEDSHPELKEETIEEKKLDPVGKADKDIDNDGDVDSSDEYLHKRRAAISKAMKEDLGKEDEPKVQKIIGKLKKASDAHAGQAKDLEKAVKEAVTQDDHGEKINQDKKDAAMKKTDQKKDFKSLRAETKIIKLGDKGKTATGKEAGAIDVEPSAKPI